VVTGAERLLLHDCWEGMRDNEFARAPSDGAPNPFPYAASHPSPDAAAHTTRHSRWPGGSLQLRGWCGEHLAAKQEGLVLSDSPPRLPTDGAATPTHCTATATHHAAGAHANCATETCRSVQLRRRLCELASRLERAKEGMVLPCPWQGLPESGRWLRDLL